MVNAILSELDNANNHNVNEIVHEINNVWEKSAKKHIKATGFPNNKKLSSTNVKYETKLEWFNKACKNKRIVYLKSLKSKEYWNIISNKLPKNSIPIKNDKIYEHFNKKLNLDSNVNSSLNHDYSQYVTQHAKTRLSRK